MTSEESTRATPRRPGVIAAAAGLILLVATVLAYLPALDAGFYFDDEPNIVDAQGVHWTEVSTRNVRLLTTHTLMPRRFVANLSFALNHVAEGLAPRGYHAVNVVIHLLVGCALFWAVWLLVREGRPREERERTLLWPALLVTGLFLLHPLNTQAVSYVVQRMTSLATLFSLLALCCYVRGRRCERGSRAGRWFVAAAALWLLGVGSKEIAFGLPPVLVAYEVCFHRQFWRTRWTALRTAPPRIRALALGLALLATGGAVLVAASYVDLGSFSLTRRLPGREFNALERLLTEPRVHVLYVATLLWPAPSQLNLDHAVEVSRGLLDPPGTSVALILWCGLGVAAVYLAARRPRLGFPLVAYFLLHALESGPLSLELAFEHRMYFPVTALAVLAACGLTDLRPGPRRIALVAGLACLPLLGALTYERNVTWADPIAFHYDCARKSPGKFRPQYNLGTLLGESGRLGEAVDVLTRAVKLEPAHSQAHNQLANALALSARGDEALDHYRTAAELDPRNAEALFNLARMLDERGLFDEAATSYRQFVEVAPPPLGAYVAHARERLRVLERGEGQ